MDIWLHILICGFALGSFYALVALGFSFIFGITHAFNLAHGEMVILSGYLAYALWKFCSFPIYWTMPVCLLAMPLGTLLLRMLLQRLKEPYELNTLVVTFGLALLLQNAMLVAFSADYRLIQPGTLQFFKLLGLPLTVTTSQVALVVLSLAATAVVHLVLRQTFLGKALRATIQDREAATLAGINVQHMGMMAFGFGGMLIGLAGPLYAQTMYLYPAAGIEATLIAIIITIFAGVGRTSSILVGSWTLGLVESLASVTLGASWREFISAAVLLALLILKPRGIFQKGGS